MRKRERDDEEDREIEKKKLKKREKNLFVRGILGRSITRWDNDGVRQRREGGKRKKKKKCEAARSEQDKNVSRAVDCWGRGNAELRS